MKIVLAISLILNVFFGILFIGKKDTPVIEKTIIETHAQPRKVKLRETRAHVVEEAPVLSELETPSKEKHLPMGEIQVDDYEVQDAGERMESSKSEYLRNELGIPEATLNEHSRLRAQFYQQNGELWNKSMTGELSFEDKRALIDLEEEYHEKLKKLYGENNWSKFQKYREKYNRDGLKRQREENRPFVFMGI